MTFDEFYLRVFGTSSPVNLLGMFIHETIAKKGGLEVTRACIERWVFRRAAEKGVIAPDFAKNVTDGLLELAVEAGSGSQKDPFTAGRF